MTGFSGFALAFLILLLGGYSAWERALLRAAGSPLAIEFQAADTATVLLATGTRVAVRAVRGVGVTRHWVALSSVSPTASNVLVTAGMLGGANARLLRLWALWGRTAGVASGQRLP